eukprot:Hpha_TRINITY_DN16386_c3_g14::TRINITY_DN16386_c3_g14_i1::g.62669::m.62669
MSLQLWVQDELRGSRFSVEVDGEGTIEDLRGAIAAACEQPKEKIPLSRLMFQGASFQGKGTMTLADSGLSAEALICITGSENAFYVVGKSRVLGTFDTVEEARQFLNKTFTRGQDDRGTESSRLVAEVKDGVLHEDPHTVGGLNQGGGAKAGFNKWWWDWSDIKVLMAIVKIHRQER